MLTHKNYVNAVIIIIIVILIMFFLYIKNNEYLDVKTNTDTMPDELYLVFKRAKYTLRGQTDTGTNENFRVVALTDPVSISTTASTTSLSLGNSLTDAVTVDFGQSSPTPSGTVSFVPKAYTPAGMQTLHRLLVVE